MEKSTEIIIVNINRCIIKNESFNKEKNFISNFISSRVKKHSWLNNSGYFL